MSTEEMDREISPTPDLVRSFQRRIALLEGELKVVREALRQADAELMKHESAAYADEAGIDEGLVERLERVESGLANHKQSIEALNASIGPHSGTFGDSVSSRLRHLELSQKTDRDAVTEVALLGPKFANLESRLQELTDLYRDLAVRLLPDTR